MCMLGGSGNFWKDAHQNVDMADLFTWTNEESQFLNYAFLVFFMIIMLDLCHERGKRLLSVLLKQEDRRPLNRLWEGPWI